MTRYTAQAFPAARARSILMAIQAGERLQIVDGNGDEIDIDRIRLPRPFTTVLYPEAPYNLPR